MSTDSSANSTTKDLPPHSLNSVKHILRFLGCTFVAFLSCTSVGYQSILPVLKREGLFHFLCNSDDKDNTCSAQELRLELMFTITMTAINISAMPAGYMAFTFGPSITCICGLIVTAVSSILFSFGNSWLCFISYITTGMGNTFIFFPLFTVPLEYVTTVQSLFFSFIVAGFDASAIIYYLFKLCYFDANISMQAEFIFLAIVFVLCAFLVQFFIFNEKFFPKPPNQENTNENDIEKVEEQPLLNKTDENEVEIDLSSLTLIQFMKTKLFFVLTLWACFYLNTKYFYIATLDAQIKWLTNDNTHYMNILSTTFNILLPCSCFYCIIAPYIINRGIKLSVLILASLSVVGAITSVIKYWGIQFITFICILYARFFYFTLIPLIIGTLYGASKQQLFYGVISIIAAIWNLTNYLWDYIVVYCLNHNFTVMNIILGLACGTSGCLVVLSLWNNKKIS